MPYKDKIKQVEYDQKRYSENRDVIVNRVRKYYKENHEVILGRGRRFYQNNRVRLIAYSLERQKKNLSDWKEYFPRVSQCGCCGKDIIFASGSPSKSIYFDHRHGGTESIRNPHIWLRQHKRTPANEAIWESCDFGKLCIKCNGYLPTINRARFIEGLLKYYKESIDA